MRSVAAFVIVMAASVAGSASAAADDGPFPSGGPERYAAVKPGTRVSRTRDGAWIGTIKKDAERIRVHDGAGPRVQFVETIFQVGVPFELAFYAERSSFYPVMLADAAIAASADGASGPRDPAFRPDAGAVIEELGKKGGLVEVRLSGLWRAGILEVRGFVPATRIGTVYQQQPERAERFAPTHVVAGSFELAGTPDGKPFARVTTKESYEAMVLAREGKHALVRVESRLVGWIAAARLERRRPPSADASDDEDGVAGGVMGGIPHPDHLDPRSVVLLENTPLRDAPSGRAIGIVRDAHVGEPAERKGDWVRFDLATRFGTIATWAKPATRAELEAQFPSPPPQVPAPASPAPRVTAGPQIVPASTIEALRVTGNREVLPDAATREAIGKSGRARIVGSLKLCLDERGVPERVTLMKSTGFPAYDATIRTTVRAWRFRPYVVSGKAAPVCTAATVIYAVK